MMKHFGSPMANDKKIYAEPKVNGKNKRKKEPGLKPKPITDKTPRRAPKPE